MVIGVGVLQKRKFACFLMFPVPQIMSSSPSKFGICSPEINALFPVPPKPLGRLIGHLLGKGCSFVVSTVSLSLSRWYPGSGVVLDCIDS